MFFSVGCASTPLTSARSLAARIVSWLSARFDLGKSAGVAATAVGQIQDLASLVEPGQRRGERVFHADFQKLLPATLAVGLVILRAAVAQHLHRESHLEVVVADEGGVLVVFLDQFPLAAGDVDAVDVVEARVAVVQTDEDLLRKLFAQALDLGRDFLNRREVFGLDLLQVDAVNVPVLVAAGVLQIEDMAAVVGPEVNTDAALFVMRDRLGRAGIVDRTDEHVQHAVARRQETELRTVRADPCRSLVGIAEQGRTRDQRDSGDRRRHGRIEILPGGRLRGLESRRLAARRGADFFGRRRGLGATSGQTQNRQKQRQRPGGNSDHDWGPRVLGAMVQRRSRYRHAPESPSRPKAARRRRATICRTILRISLARGVGFGRLPVRRSAVKYDSIPTRLQHRDLRCEGHERSGNSIRRPTIELPAAGDRVRRDLRRDRG